MGNSRPNQLMRFAWCIVAQTSAMRLRWTAVLAVVLACAPLKPHMAPGVEESLGGKPYEEFEADVKATREKAWAAWEAGSDAFFGREGKEKNVGRAPEARALYDTSNATMHGFIARWDRAYRAAPDVFAQFDVMLARNEEDLGDIDEATGSHGQAIGHYETCLQRAARAYKSVTASLRDDSFSMVLLTPAGVAAFRRHYLLHQASAEERIAECNVLLSRDHYDRNDLDGALGHLDSALTVVNDPKQRAWLEKERVKVLETKLLGKSSRQAAAHDDTAPQVDYCARAAALAKARPTKPEECGWASRHGTPGFLACIDKLGLAREACPPSSDCQLTADGNWIDADLSARICADQKRKQAR